VERRRKRRLFFAAAALAAAVWTATTMWSSFVNALLYFPSRGLDATPGAVGLAYTDLEIPTTDGERLHGWWIPARRQPAIAHVLFFHGNGGNISHRVAHARVLSDAGLDVLLFDYRGYGRSTGSVGEAGTYLDARAARAALLAQTGITPASVLYLGESLGGAVATELAVAEPPAGLVLQSTFTSVRDMARLHYAVIPAAVVPDVYPTIDRIARLRCPVLIVHGEQDDIVPVEHGRALFAAATGNKRLDIVPDAGHNDLLTAMGTAYGWTVAEWARGLPRP
jgi:pimeloyl-ACP methyl ester carboxylesterase